MSDPGLTATIHPSTASIAAEVWNALAPGTDGRPDNPFLDHAFFLALEESGSATMETGLVVQVPLFINPGEKLIIKTEDGSYISRA